VDQFVDNDGNVIELRESFVFMENKRLGRVELGRTDSASDDLDNITLGQIGVVADNGPQSWSESFFLRAGTGELLTDVRWGDFFPGTLGDRDNIVKYVSPEYKGFQALAAWGKDDFWDVGLHYRDTWREVLEVEAGVGFFRNTTEGNSAAVFDPVNGKLIGNEPTREDEHWGTGLSMLHKPSGLNFAINYSRETHTDDCVQIVDVPGGQTPVSNPGAVSGECRGPDEFVWAQAGIIRTLFPSLGPTAFYGEYYWAKREWNESDPDKLRALELNPNEALELEETVLTAWGAGVVQHVSGDGKGRPFVHLFLAWKHHELDVDLIDFAGEVPSKKIEDFDVIGTGMSIRF
jgi:hypothetical protein